MAIFAVIAAIASAVGQKAQADSQNAAARYNTAVNKNNAETAAQQTQFDAEQIRDRNKRVLGAQRAAYSASGVDPDSATAIDVRNDSAQQGEMDALIAIYTGQTSANANIARARLNELEGKNAQSAGRWGVATSLLGGATQAAGYASKASNPKFGSN
jgi:hypothetical protein